MPAVSKHRYFVATDPDSDLRSQLQRAFYKTDLVEFKRQRHIVPDGTYLVVGMNDSTGVFQLARWRDEGVPSGPLEDPY